MSNNIPTLDPRTLSAINYYVGTPDGQFLKGCGAATMAKKAYVTVNSLMRQQSNPDSHLDSPEYLRFIEGKKQTPDLISVEGINGILEMVRLMYVFAKSRDQKELQTLRAGRKSEVEVTGDEAQVITCFQSTTKDSLENLVNLGYTQKKDLAICKFHLHPSAVILDMESLGNAYGKPEEREVLILPSNCQIVTYVGEDPTVLGKDNLPAKRYDVHVYGPDQSHYFDSLSTDEEFLRGIVFDFKNLVAERIFYEALNTNIGGEFPEMPSCHYRWKQALNELIRLELRK